MSGGVDSSVSALLLKEAGYRVVGAFIRGWYPPFLTCSWKEDRRDAMRVAADLGIEFTTIDAEEAYKKHVVDYMIEEYKRGRTPNPDVMCNRHVKFGVFSKEARTRGADFIATGHYAAIGSCDGEPTLAFSKDTQKDQTYFLWTLSNDVLKHILFPLGDLTKNEVREKATQHGLVTANKGESQGVCFLGEVSMKDFLSHYVDAREGDVLDEHGTVIGSHPGALFFTLGERRGFTITQKTPEDKPRFVVEKDIETNTITVSTRDTSSLNCFARSEYLLEDMNWTCDVKSGDTLQARFRHRGELLDITLAEKYPDTARISFEEPQTTLAPGQSVVLYRDNICVGGGVCGMLDA